MRERLVIAAAALLLAACGDGGSTESGRAADGGSPRSGRAGGAADESTGTGDAAGTPSGIRFLTGGGGGGDERFARATSPRVFRFPEDHGSHPQFRSEWWYFTGNVLGAGGRHYGFELTFFRYALAADAPASLSAWSTNQFWMAHLAVTDTRSDELIAEERLTRGALGLAGAEPTPLRVWVEDWSVASTPGAAGGVDSFAVDARGDRVALGLTLEPLKPPVPHGDRGLDPKGPEPGNASYYYSIPRMAVRGRLSVDGENDAVEGYAWMDREWSTSALSPELEGWDWFALQLSDGRELMVYRLRRRDGTASPYSGGSLIDAAGNRRALGVDDVTLEPLRHWQSPRSGARYPVAWRLTVPAQALRLEIRPYVDDQEIDLSVRYWEGAVEVQGTVADDPITGNGYLELAGY